MEDRHVKAHSLHTTWSLKAEETVYSTPCYITDQEIPFSTIIYEKLRWRCGDTVSYRYVHSILKTESSVHQLTRKFKICMSVMRICAQCSCKYTYSYSDTSIISASLLKNETGRARERKIQKQNRSFAMLENRGAAIKVETLFISYHKKNLVLCIKILIQRIQLRKIFYQTFK